MIKSDELLKMWCNAGDSVVRIKELQHAGAQTKLKRYTFINSGGLVGHILGKQACLQTAESQS
jgi:hypothetical protein